MTRKILCVQLADIGDLVVSTPALSALRDHLPDAHITLLTTPHAVPVAAHLPDETITFDKHTFDSPKALINPVNMEKLLSLTHSLRRGKFDTIVFFHHFSTWFGVVKFIGMAAASGASRRIGLLSDKTPFLNEGIPEKGFGAMHQAQYWLRLVEIAAGEPSQAVEIGERPANIAIETDLAAFDLPETRPLIAMHAGSGGFSSARRWEPEKFAQVAAQLIAERGTKIVFVGGAGDDTASVLNAFEQVGTQHAVSLQNDVVDLTGKTSLAELAGVLQQCDLFIGADSGVMHVAAASGVPVVAIFGPSNDTAWHPYTPESSHIVVRSAPICSPCSYVGTGVGLREGCAARTCMRMVSVGDVVGAADELLRSAEIPVRTQHAVSLQNNMRKNRVNILGVPVDSLTYDKWLDMIGAWVDSGDRLHHMCTVNPEFVMIAQRDPNFFNILNRADVCLADGVGLIYAARYLGKPLIGRITGSDGVPKIAERAAKTGWRLYFLGAWEGIAEKAANVLREQYPGVQIVGTFSGSPRPEDEDALVEMVNAANADILLVAYGAPVQDKWIARNAPRLNVKVAMGVGGTFDYVSGEIALAPQWLRDAGFEWLYRLIRQPWRLKRQLRIPAFMVAVLLRGRRSKKVSESAG